MFNSFDVSTITAKKSASVNPARGRVASCYITENNYITCLVMHKVGITIYLYAYVYDTNLIKKKEQNLNYYVVPDFISFPYFIKCIHLKGEIGVFLFIKHI